MGCGVVWCVGVVRGAGEEGKGGNIVDNGTIHILDIVPSFSQFIGCVSKD